MLTTVMVTCERDNGHGGFMKGGIFH